MIGRQVILTNRAFTLEELRQFMEQRWDRERYNDFTVGSPTDMSVQMYIMLPATARYLVIVYSRAEGGLFSKSNKVVLSVANTPSGMSESFLWAIPARSILSGAVQMGSHMSAEKERKGPAEEALQQYAAYMRSLLQEAGYLA